MPNVLHLSNTGIRPMCATMTLNHTDCFLAPAITNHSQSNHKKRCSLPNRWVAMKKKWAENVMGTEWGGGEGGGFWGNGQGNSGNGGEKWGEGVIVDSDCQPQPPAGEVVAQNQSSAIGNRVNTPQALQCAHSHFLKAQRFGKNGLLRIP